MNLDFVKRVATKINTKREDMVEKDIMIHQILTDLSNDSFISENFVFKGGTCLIKHHLGYLRFSEDIDFTWKNQSRFDGKSAKETRRDLSGIIDTVGKTFEGISKKRGLDFKCVKSDRKYVEIGSSNKICTFKIWYYSESQKNETFIKVQINFDEYICTEHEKGSLHSAVRRNDEEMKALFEEYEEYSETIPFPVYGAKEILSEKVRALLTRRGIKARDFLDIYFIQKVPAIVSAFEAADQQKTVYEILNKNGSMWSGDLYKECKKEHRDLIDKTYRNHMKKLQEMGLIQKKSSGRWKRYEVI